MGISFRRNGGQAFLMLMVALDAFLLTNHTQRLSTETTLRNLCNHSELVPFLPKVFEGDESGRFRLYPIFFDTS